MRLSEMLSNKSGLLSPTGARTVFYDCETWKISAELPAPPLVCLQYGINDGPAEILGGLEPDKDHAKALFRSWLSDPNTTLVAHNGFYDLSVMLGLDKYWRPNAPDTNEAILQVAALALAGRIRDTLVMGKLNAIEFGWMSFDRLTWKKPKFSLAYLAKRFCGIVMEGKEGDDVWRLRYKELDGIHPSEWPAPARQYALDDINHLRPLFHKLDENKYADEKFQTACYWVFRLMELWGLHTNEARVESLKSKVLPYIASAHGVLIDHGLIRPGEWKTNHEKFEEYVVALCSARGQEPKWTPSGKVVRTAKYLESFGVPLLFDKRHWQEQQEPTRDMKAIKHRVFNWYTERGLPIPLVDKKPKDEDYDYFTGGPDDDAEDVEVKDPLEGLSTDRDALISTDDPDLKLLGEIGKLKTLAGTFIPKMEQGYVNPLRPAWNGLVVTGRPSCSAGSYGTNLLNQPREVRKDEAGVREVYQARPGYVYIDGDAVQAELCGLAQICIDKFGYSRMGEVIRSGKDLHAWFGAQLMERDYDDVVAGCKLYKAMPGGDPRYKWAADARQMAKACNFGFPGGLGVKKFIKWARKQYQVLFTERQVKRYKQIWLESFPEIADYFEWVNDQIKSGIDGKFTYTSHRSLRRRGDCGFCDGANNGFQSLIADAVKNAMLKVFIACHTSGDDLLGGRLCAQIYDEMLLEVPIEGASAAARRFKDLFESGINEYLPDCPAKVEVEMMFNWSKLAKAVYNADGDLIPFDR